MYGVVVVFVVGAVALLDATLQTITVRGITTCNMHRLANAKVELWDRDVLDPNDLLASIHSNADGEFALHGSDDEYRSIEPFLRIRHNCKAKPGCARIADFVIPKEKINGTYEMTYVNLDILTAGETEECN